MTRPSLIHLGPASAGLSGNGGPRAPLAILQSALTQRGWNEDQLFPTAVPSGPLLALAPVDGTMAGLRSAAALVRQQRLARLVTFSPQQHLFAREALGMDESRLDLIPPPVDTEFFSPTNEPPPSTPRKFLTHGFPEHQTPRLSGDTLQPISSPLSDHSSRRQLIQQAHWLVLGAPDRSASGGLTLLLEAFACGCPVVAPRTFTMEFLLAPGDNCLDYVPGAVGSLEKALRRAQTLEAEHLPMRHACRRFVLDHCTLDHFVARMTLLLSHSDLQPPRPVYYVVPGRIACAP